MSNNKPSDTRIARCPECDAWVYQVDMSTDEAPNKEPVFMAACGSEHLVKRVEGEAQSASA